MSPDDTLPEAPVTTPTLPDDEPPSVGSIPPIPAGEAQQIVSKALDALAGAFLNVEALAMACARALDSATTKGTTP